MIDLLSRLLLTVAGMLLAFMLHQYLFERQIVYRSNRKLPDWDFHGVCMVVGIITWLLAHRQAWPLPVLGFGIGLAGAPVGPLCGLGVLPILRKRPKRRRK